MRDILCAVCCNVVSSASQPTSLTSQALPEAYCFYECLCTCAKTRSPVLLRPVVGIFVDGNLVFPGGCCVIVFEEIVMMTMLVMAFSWKTSVNVK